MKTKKGLYKLCILSLTSLFASCAQQGAPVGGPEDVMPPRVVSARPANYSISYNADKILITFDEYLDMGNFTQELIVSPPMEEKPIVKMRNKTLIIEFEEELKDDVTYTFNFGSGIKDLNEGNELLNFEYVFSTGDFLDSLSIKGKLKNAFDLSIPESPILVMLYTEFYDSVPLVKIPYYIGRTDKEGNFAVNNLKPGEYKVFVLMDANNNLLYDLPTEQIAFLDSRIQVDAEYFREILLTSGVYDSSDLIPDTTVFNFDTTGMTPDSIAMIRDSIEQAQPDFNSIWIDLYMFSEKDKNQYISDYSRKKREFATVLFNNPVSDSFNFWPFYPTDLTKEGIIDDMGTDRDTLTLWMADTLIASYDTIGMVFNYVKLDSMEIPFWNQDTVLFTYFEKTTSRKKSSGEEKKGNAPLKVNTVSNNGRLPLFKDLVFNINQPIKSIDPSKFELFLIPDSIEIPERINPEIDSAKLNRVRIRKKWKEEGKYRLVLYPGAITNIYENTNDTIDKTFNIRPVADYARINLVLENVGEEVLIQILNSDKILRQIAAHESNTYVFENLEPNTYEIKFIHDKNGNGKWDTGDYLNGRQPEKVEYYPKQIKVRANWDHELNYTMGSNENSPVSADNGEN